MTAPICPCDGDMIAAPTNLPQLSTIAYRVGDFADFRAAVLTPLPGEESLSVDGVPAWRTDGAGDLAVMIADWFAYIADILTFYNERIANQDYLRTADLPESVNHLIALLGYRPRPAIGATGVLAALVTAGQSAILPKGLQFQSKPLPGQSPQIFELSADTPIASPDQIPAAPAPVLLAQVEAASSWHRVEYVHKAPAYGADAGGGSVVTDPTPVQGNYSLLLNGAVTTIDPGALLVLRPRDASVGSPMLASVTSAVVQPTASGGPRTAVGMTLSATPPGGLTAAGTSLDKANQTTGLWSFFSGAVGGTSVHLASLVRQIRPGDWLLFTAPSLAPALIQVQSTSETIWDATGSAAKPDVAKDTTHPVPIPHTVLTLASALSTAWNSVAGSVTVQFGWIPAGALLDQPYSLWSGTPTALVATSAQTFPPNLDLPILLQDSSGGGIQATGSSSGDTNLLLGGLPSPAPSLQPPFAVLPNLLAVTRGKTVANEVLGSGDATNPAQSFQLSQSPVTYLQQGAVWASTISLTVKGQPWMEVASFYGQAPDATIFVTYEDNGGSTHVQFGDGVNGARLPTGINNVVATYRIGAGAASPPAGKLTVISQSYPGLRAVLNPVAVGGGSDADPPDQIRRNAPRSVLAFGRAVSVFDYEAIAAEAPGVTRARAVWAWDDARQRTVVTIYVGDDSAAATSAKSVLAASGDPNRPVKIVQATNIPVALTLSLVTTPGMDFSVISAAIAIALTDTETGLFGSWQLAIGQPLFDSQIEAAVLAVPGAVAIIASTFLANGIVSPGPLHSPGEGGFYTLDPADFTPIPEPSSNGG
jgi:hypothetical protein